MSEIDLQKLDIAIIYAQRMADGKNPVTDQPSVNDSVINNPNVIRCMFFIRDVLQKVKDNGGIISKKASPGKISFPVEVLNNFIYQKDQTITAFISQLKNLCNNPDTVKLNPVLFTNWLREQGYLITETDKYTGEKKTSTTAQGEDFGLHMEERTAYNGRPYHLIFYGQKAQEYLVEHFKEITGLQ